MDRKKFRLKAPQDFSFWRTVLSHGWCALPPFHLDKEQQVLRRVLQTTIQVVLVEIRECQRNQLEISVEAQRLIKPEEIAEIKSQIVYLLRPDESLQDFHQALLDSKDNGYFQWIIKARAGRMLRSPTLFEDVVKMICTTNCSWSATEGMVENLVQKLGTRFNQKYADFPSAEQLAATSETFLIKEVRAGYRSAYLTELAERVASGKLDLNLWLSQTGSDLYKQILSIKGIGPYAAGNLLKLLGHYDYLALDSWCRAKFSRIYRQGKNRTPDP